MGRDITLEICIDSLESALKIQEVSAQFYGLVKWRIELCSNLVAGGGLTPSVGLLQACRAALPYTDIMVMIRPRIGSFVYSESELKTMMKDIELLGKEGASGFVFGCLTSIGEVDIDSMERLEEYIQGRPVTFHRAFDLTPNIGDAYGDLDSLHFVTRVLTSGQGRTAMEGLPELQSLSEAHTVDPYNLVAILPGSGINGDMLPDFLSKLPLITEVHLSASEAVDEEPGWANDQGKELGFGNGKVWTLNTERLRKAFQAVRDLQDQ